jgi:hypothetical protein
VKTVNDPKLRAALHAVYVALFQTHQASPLVFRDNDLTRLLTSLMGSRPWSWRVIGVTPKALALYSEANFEKPKGNQIQRGHVRPRVSTARELFKGDAPLNLQTFFETFLESDRTVLMTREENPSRARKGTEPDIRGADIPSFFPIDQTLDLFQCGSLIGYIHRKEETNFLSKLNAAPPKPMTYFDWVKAVGRPRPNALRV